MTDIDISALSAGLGYVFEDEKLLLEALRHSSYVNEQPEAELRDNERFEFLGDAVLSLAVGHLLMQRYPDLREGDLTRIRASLVNESRLAQISRKIGLGAHIQLGEGEAQSEGREKNSILANALEAAFAAIYLDDGFETACRTIHHHFSALIDTAIGTGGDDDYKSQLQEWVQTEHRITPQYEVIEESGPDHSKVFRIRLHLLDLTTEGVGKSKKTAEQRAARRALEILQTDTDR